MRVLGLVTQKGSPGKSTTGASLAVVAIERGFKVFVLELDRQSTWSAWIATRAQNNNDNNIGIDFETIESSQLSAALATLERAGYDLVFLASTSHRPALRALARTTASRSRRWTWVPARAALVEANRPSEEVGAIIPRHDRGIRLQYACRPVSISDRPPVVLSPGWFERG